MIERLARLGYLSVGIVYGIVGLFAAAAGLGRRRAGTDQHDAFQVILRQPFGRVALTIIAAGLIGYVIWRVVSGITDSEHRGSDPKGLALRAGSIGRGLIYALLSIEVIRLIARKGSSGGSDAKTRHWMGRLMDMPFGHTLAALAGLGVIAYGAYQLYAAVQSKLSKQLRLGPLSASARKNVIAISRFGLAARGAVFLVIGGSIARAALKHDAGAARGTSGALREIAVPANGWLLVVIGVGLVAYGIYALINARYRNISAT